MSCTYTRCRAANLCKSGYCVGAELAKQNMEIRFGEIVRKSEDTEKEKTSAE